MNNQQITQLARQTADQFGYLKRLPAPNGIAAGGTYDRQRTKNKIVLRYKSPDGLWHRIGDWSLDDDAQPSSNGARPQPAPGPYPQPALAGPAPLILIQPGPAGARFDAYGIELPDIIEELRRCLIHLVATSAGANVVSLHIARDAAVSIPRHPAAASRPHKAAGKVRHTVNYDNLDWDAESDDADLD